MTLWSKVESLASVKSVKIDAKSEPSSAVTFSYKVNCCWRIFCALISWSIATVKLQSNEFRFLILPRHDGMQHNFKAIFPIDNSAACFFSHAILSAWVPNEPSDFWADIIFLLNRLTFTNSMYKLANCFIS